MIMPRFMPILSLLLPWVTAAGVLAEIPLCDGEVCTRCSVKYSAGLQFVASSILCSQTFPETSDLDYSNHNSLVQLCRATFLFRSPLLNLMHQNHGPLQTPVGLSANTYTTHSLQ